MPPIRHPIRFPFPRLWATCLAAALSAVVIVSFYGTLNRIENVLPRFGFFSIRELNVAAHDVSHCHHAEVTTPGRLGERAGAGGNRALGHD